MLEVALRLLATWLRPISSPAHRRTGTTQPARQTVRRHIKPGVIALRGTAFGASLIWWGEQVGSALRGLLRIP